MTYRRDVDGLRAVAILAVILFHADIHGFEGGFVGVDIFFVISGFFIGGMVWRETAAGGFSFRKFYLRRARRLLPALLPMLVVSTVAVAWMFVPKDLIPFGNSLVWTLVGWSNMAFWQWAQDYFAASTQLAPLLHTWSLGVEEQFYLVMPAVIYGICRATKRHATPLMVGLLIAAFLFQFLTEASGIGRFYLMPCRAWEFLWGALICLPNVPVVRSGAGREIEAMLGLALIGLAVVGYAPLPVAGALPCLGAMLIIHAGGTGQPRVNRMLGTQPMVFIGLISYSLYLWHWPLLAFARYWYVYDLPLQGSMAILVLSIVLATLSWYYVERPFRRHVAATGHRMRLGLILVPLGAVGLVGVLFGFSDGLPGRLAPNVAQLASAAENFDPRRQDCLMHEPGGVGPCLYGAVNAEPSFAVLGDSQAAALAPGIAKVALGSGQAFRLFAMAGCRPAMGYKSPGNSCDWHTHAAVTAILADQRLKVVVIAAEYGNTIYNGLGGSQLHPEAEPSLVADFPMLFPNKLPAHQKLFAARFSNTIRQLAQSGRRIILVEPVPDVGVDVPRALARLAARSADWGGFVWPRSYYNQRQGFVLSLFDELAESYPGITLAQPQDRLCDSISCRVSWQSSPLYIDSYHLSLVGADLAATAITPDMLVPR